VALQDRARNEPRDLYDLWFLTSHAGADIGHLIGAITEKLRFREKDVADIEDRIIAKEARLETLWDGRLEHQLGSRRWRSRGTRPLQAFARSNSQPTFVCVIFGNFDRRTGSGLVAVAQRVDFGEV
jgi:hypothetical protein